ncbi:MAG: tetratricopeptide repeat protein [Thermodesulfovibrio sp.]|nr:tetratricopeptide repeat protein [Thermodesulfovibrio sp.]MDW7971743.1 tetratricopeptide repeat protein [Thermodesulfovibrio sp.]
MRQLQLIIILFIFYITGCATLPEIHEAAKRGDIEEIEKLLKQGEDINRYEWGTPLIYAAGAGHLETVKFLVSKGADVNIEMFGYGNALCNALVNEHWEVAKFLIYAGTDIERTYGGLQRWKNFVTELGIDESQEVIAKINKAEKALPELILEVTAQFWLEKKYEKVISLANEVLKRQPDSFEAYAILAHGYHATGKFDEAIKYAEMSLKIQKNSTAYMALGRIYSAKGEKIKAIDNFKKALEINPKETTANFEIGVILAEQEKFREAQKAFLKEIERVGDKSIEAAPSLLFVSILDLDLGNYAGSLNSSTKVIELLQFSGIGARVEIAGKYPVIREVTESAPAQKAGLEVGDRILKINGQSTEGWDGNKIIQNLRGPEGSQVVLTIERKGWDKPKDFVVVRETIFDKKAASAFAVRAFARRELGNKEDFFKDAEKAYSINHNDTWARRAMVVALIDKGNFSEALKILPEEKTNFDRLLETIIYARLENMKRASETYSQILEEYFITKSAFKQRYITLAQNSLKPYKESKLKTTKEYEAKWMYKEALKEYQEYLILANEKEAKEVRSHIAELIMKYPHLFTLPEEARKLVIRAEAFTSEGKFEKAIEEYKKALKFSPFFPALYKALALNYAQLRDYKLAIKNMNLYLELYPDAPDARAAKDEIYKWEFELERQE